jgi:hypothetical protein
MDKKLRSELQTELAPCSAQRFIDAYAVAHRAKFGEDFIVGTFSSAIGERPGQRRKNDGPMRLAGISSLQRRSTESTQHGQRADGKMRRLESSKPQVLTA